MGGQKAAEGESKHCGGNMRGGNGWTDDDSNREERAVTEYSMSAAITRAVLPETAAPIYGAPKHDADGLFFRRGFRGQKCTAAAAAGPAGTRRNPIIKGRKEGEQREMYDVR